MLLNLILISKSVLAKTYFFPAGNPNYKFIGRIDFTDSKKPTMWATGTQVSFSFKGNHCVIGVTDQLQFGKNHNYLDIVVNGRYRRIKLTDAHNEILIGKPLAGNVHEVIISKSTEAGVG